MIEQQIWYICEETIRAWKINLPYRLNLGDIIHYEFLIYYAEEIEHIREKQFDELIKRTFHGDVRWQVYKIEIVEKGILQAWISPFSGRETMEEVDLFWS